MRWNARLALSAGLAAAVLVAAASAQGTETTSSWKVVDLGTLHGGSSVATGLNGRGQVVGLSGSHAFLWARGKLRDLGALRGKFSPPGNPVGINNRGDVALARNTATYQGYEAWHAFRWRNGKLADLGTLGKDAGGDLANQSRPLAISDRGDILVESTTNGMGASYWAFLWRDGRKVTFVRPYGRRLSNAVAINQHGQVAGWIGTGPVPEPSNRGHAFLWQKGKLKTLAPASGRRWSSASAMNARGTVVGTSYDDVPHERARATRWSAGTVKDLGVLPGTDTSYATAISADGWIVGVCRGTESGRYHAFLWKQGKMSDLGSFADVYGQELMINRRDQILSSKNGIWRNGGFQRLPTLGGQKFEANAINDRGEIVGWSTTAKGKRHATLWIPR